MAQVIERGDVDVLVTTTGSMAADTSVDVGVQVARYESKRAFNRANRLYSTKDIARADYDLASTA